MVGWGSCLPCRGCAEGGKDEGLPGCGEFEGVGGVDEAHVVEGFVEALTGFRGVGGGGEEGQGGGEGFGFLLEVEVGFGFGGVGVGKEGFGLVGMAM